jgi:shikimate dehydrogenase
LLTEAPARLAILNRTWKKAKKIAHDFAALGPITAVTPSDPGSYDLIINATGGQTTDAPLNLPAIFLQPNGLCYELGYGESPTPFSLWASRLKANYTNGIGMLVEQAAESFYIWHGLRPQTKTVLSLLKMS